MKVLHVISDSNIGGAGVLLTTLLRHFDRERVQSVVALPEDSALIPRIRDLDVPIRTLRHPCDRFSFASLREVRRILSQEDADLIHTNAALTARFAGRLSHIPVLHTRHCCFPPQGIWRLSAVRRLGGICNRWLSDRVIATAEAAAENLRALGIPQEKMEVILNGSEEVREVDAEELAALRRAYALTDEDFTVGICARLEACKGHDVFLRAAKRAMTLLPTVRFRFLIAGDGSRRGELEQLARDLGIADAVRFLGFVGDMAPIYRLLRINVNCSCGTETSCLALSEGMSASLPTIASDYGGNRAMLEGSGAGLLFPTGDADALADAICRIASDTLLERGMKRAARARYLKTYTAEQMTDRLTAVYETMKSGV